MGTDPTGGFALLDILQPCPSFNRQNTFRWYKDRVRSIDPSHDPTDRIAALKLAFTWGGQIPIGVYYKCDRPTFESQLNMLKNGPLADTNGNGFPA